MYCFKGLLYSGGVVRTTLENQRLEWLKSETEQLFSIEFVASSLMLCSFRIMLYIDVDMFK